MFSLRVFCICLLLELACATPTNTYYYFKRVGIHVQKDLIVAHATEDGETTWYQVISTAYYHFQQVGTDIQTGLILLHTTEEGQTTGPMTIYMYGFETLDAVMQNKRLAELKRILGEGEKLHIALKKEGPTPQFPEYIVEYDTISLSEAVKEKDQALLTLNGAKLIRV